MTDAVLRLNDGRHEPYQADGTPERMQVSRRLLFPLAPKGGFILFHRVGRLDDGRFLYIEDQDVTS